MRFVLCCIICLGVLYALILRHDGYLVDPGGLVEAASTMPKQAGTAIAAAAGPQIAARIEAYCRQETAACLAGAAALADPIGTAHAAPHRKGRVSLRVGAP